MRLLDNLRQAEQKSVQAVRRSVERAREEWMDVERRIRQKMRIYPQKLHRMSPETEIASVPDIMDEGIPAGISEPAETEKLRKPAA
jgi:hypothetical protein